MVMNARDITKALGGDWQGSYGLVPGIDHSRKDRSVKVWDGPDGEPMAHSFTDEPWQAIKADWQQRGLLPEWRTPERINHQERQQQRQQTQERQEQREKDRQAETAKKIQAAREIFQKAGDAKGSPVANYLNARGLTIEPPLSLRYAPGLTHGPTGLHLPAMVGAVQNVAGQITGIHRTFLVSGGRQKAPVTDNKMMLGPCAGGAVRLARAENGMCIGEGIETMLSVQQETGRPCWAALTTSGLKALMLPANIVSVMICADRDNNGAGEKAAQAAAQRWKSEGRKVRIAWPPEGFKDFNDALQAGANKGISA